MKLDRSGRLGEDTLVWVFLDNHHGENFLRLSEKGLTSPYTVNRDVEVHDTFMSYISRVGWDGKYAAIGMLDQATRVHNTFKSYYVSRIEIVSAAYINDMKCLTTVNMLRYMIEHLELPVIYTKMMNRIYTLYGYGVEHIISTGFISDLHKEMLNSYREFVPRGSPYQLYPLNVYEYLYYGMLHMLARKDTYPMASVIYGYELIKDIINLGDIFPKQLFLEALYQRLNVKNTLIESFVLTS